MRNVIGLGLLLWLSGFVSAQCGGTLVWYDEFSGSSLDMTKWTYDLGDGCPSLCGWGNSELEYYTNSTNNVRVAGNQLTIETRAENAGGRAFTSGKIHTNGKFSQTYGRFEARMRLPQGRGLWPAFWLLPTVANWPTTGEIDIMEYRGDIINQSHGTLHYGNPWPGNLWDGTQYTSPVNDLHTAFHTYAVEWEPGEIRWYFDNIRFKTEIQTPNSLNPASNNANAWPWSNPFYIILNQAVGGWFTGTTNNADVQLTKATFEIDYVRVYDMTPSIGSQVPYYGTPAAIPGTIQAEDFDRGCDDAAYSDNEILNQGGMYRQEDVDIETTGDATGTYDVGYIVTNEWLEYTINAAAGGIYNFQFRVASQPGGGRIRLEIDGVSAGTVNVGATGGWQTWATVNLNNVSVSAGDHIFRIFAEVGDFNFNYFSTTAISLPNRWILASHDEDQSLLKWLISESCPPCTFDVQYLDGTDWKSLEKRMAGSAQQSFEYYLPAKSFDAMRIVQQSADGNLIYSNVINTENEEIQYHPNPFESELVLTNLTSEPILYSIFGQEIPVTKTLHDNSWILHTEQLPSGMYLLRDRLRVIQVIKK